MTRRILLLAWAAALMLPCGALAQSGYDSVTLRDKSKKKGTISKMGKTVVMLDRGGFEDEISVHDIVGINFTGEPSTLRAARSMMEETRWQDALGQLQRIDPKNVPRKVIVQEIEYFKAYCTAKLAVGAGRDEKKKAIEQILAFVEANPSTYHYYEAAELLGDLSSALGDHQAAAKYYASVGSAPWADYKLRAAVLLGQARQAAGDFPAALQGFEYVLKSSLTGPLADRQKLLAQLGKAVCLAQGGDPEKGIGIARKIIADNDPKDRLLFARAYMALGACHQKQGKAKDALLDYLHVDLLFNADAVCHAEALYRLTELWTEVRRPDRAQQARTMLKAHYPGSSWASK